MDAKLTVSIIVACRNEREQIATCVRSILAQEPPVGGFEIIVADGMSDDGTREILQQLAKEHPRLRVIDNPGRIVPKGLNAALKIARGQFIFRMDAHTEYAPNYIYQCLRVHRETRAENVGGPARTISSGFLQSAICAAYHSPFAVGGARFHKVDYEGYVDTVPYGCWPREVFDRVGYFDEDLVRNQDDEFNLRLLRVGGKIWQSPEIKSSYKPRGSLSALFSQYMQYGYWKVRVIQKHKTPASIRHLIPGCFAFSVILLSLSSLFWKPALWSLIGLLGTYSICNLAASFLTARQTQWSFLAVLPIVFAIYHISYGYGFLRGIIDFIILRRRPSRIFTELTRPSSDTDKLFNKKAG